MRESIESYLGDCRARNLKASTVGSYEKTFEHLEAFCRRGGVIHVDRIDLSLLTDFRLSPFMPAKSEDETPRPIKPSTSGKELETLRALRVHQQARLDSGEPRQGIRPAARRGATDAAFERDEVEKIHAGARR